MMANKIKRLSIVFSVFYWMLVAFYFVTVSYFGLGKYVPSNLHYVDVVGYSAAVGISIGLLFGFFPLSQMFSFKNRTSFPQVVLLSTSCYILFFAMIIFLASLYGNTFHFALSYVLSPDGLVALFHLSIASLLYHFVLQINKKFGPGVLLGYTLGRYFAPKQEDRAFMFLDLKSSTSIAEALDHISYSRMIQDCFAELTVPIIDYKVQVHQYAGDEVVVSWKMDQSFIASYCYKFFYAFQKRLEAKKDHFLFHYGVCPQFKAGVHCGNVTVAEVGEIKTEIAYHGDVLNTASRIQGLCNDFQKEILVSESFLRHLPQKHHGLATFVVDAALKGKENTIKIFTIANPVAVGKLVNN